MTKKRIKPNHHESGGPLSDSLSISSLRELQALQLIRAIDHFRSMVPERRTSELFPAVEFYQLVDEIVESLQIHISVPHYRTASYNYEIIEVPGLRDELGNTKMKKVREPRNLVTPNLLEIQGLAKIRQELVSLKRNRALQKELVITPVRRQKRGKKKRGWFYK